MTERNLKIRGPASFDDAEHWLEAYGRVRPQDASRPSQWLGIPLAVASLVGLLWSIPTPDAFGSADQVLNWGTVFLMVTVVYYFILSISLAFGSLPFVVGVAALSAWLERLGIPLWPISALTFAVIAAWHLVETRRLTGRVRAGAYLQHLMIGPLWLLAACYRRLGIPY